MRCLILYAALFGAVAGYRKRPMDEFPSYGSTYKPAVIETTIKPDVTTWKIETPTTEAATTSSTTPSSTTLYTTKKYQKESLETTTTSSQSPPASSSETNLLEPVTDLPITLPPFLPQLPNRHVVTYDQRQEGQYNIRADLDNFMIILVPPSPTQGLGILDLLTKSSLRRTSPHTTKSKKKHYYSAAASLNSSPSKQLGYYPHHDQHQQQLISRASEFIDGRTPYHVDISSLNEDKIQPRLNPDKQVDVLPPPYPLAYQHHLMKPYHLEAETSLLPPSEIGLHNNADSAPSDHNTGYYRFARYIRGDNFLDSNSLTSSNRIANVHQPYIFKPLQKLPVYRPENSMGAAELYPPLDVPKFTEEESRNFESDDNDVHSDNFASELGDDVDLAFIDDTILEDRHKTAYSDEIERCAPGKRRDSYGVCREIEVY